MSKEKLNESKPENIENNFLKEEQNFAPNEKIAVVKDLPPMETIVFRNNRDNGQVLEFHFEDRKKNCPLTHYEFFDGKTYTLPIPVIEHLENCKEPIYEEVEGEGGMERRIKAWKYNFSCKVVRK